MEGSTVPYTWKSEKFILRACGFLFHYIFHTYRVKRRKKNFFQWNPDLQDYQFVSIYNFTFFVH